MVGMAPCSTTARTCSSYMTRSAQGWQPTSLPRSRSKQTRPKYVYALPISGKTALLHPLTRACSQEIEDNLLKKHGSAEAVAAFKASQAIKEAEAAAKAKMMSLRMGLSLVDLSSGYKLPADWREESLNKTNAKKVSRSNLPVVVSRDRDRCCRRSCSFFHRCASPICLVLSCAFILAGQAAEARVCLESSDESPSLCHERLPL